MGNVIIVLILALIAILAVRSGLKHFKGEGGCCGGGGELKPEKKKLTEPKIAEKRVLIEGMHCDNCKNSVEKELNKIEGAAARVNLHKKTAVVDVSRDVSDEEIRAAVEKAGFETVKIETEAI